MNPIEEAETLRYSNGVIRILPQSDGSWIVFLPAGRLEIMPGLDEENLRAISMHENAVWTAHQNRYHSRELHAQLHRQQQNQMQGKILPPPNPEKWEIVF